MVFHKLGARLSLVLNTNCWSLHFTNMPTYFISCYVYGLQQSCINIRMETRTALQERLATRTEKITQALVITDYYIFSVAEENFFEVCLQSSPSSINIALLLTLCHESSTDENTHPPHRQWQISLLALLGLSVTSVFVGLRVQQFKNNEKNVKKTTSARMKEQYKFQMLGPVYLKAQKDYRQQHYSCLEGDACREKALLNMAMWGRKKKKPVHQAYKDIAIQWN